ncbi:MAG: 5'-3' exonuclease H3TH domain-containing protein [Candidatus Hodarchaeota archaeon]
MRIAIIDGNYLTYRSYYANVNWYDNEDMCAVYGFKKALETIKKNLHLEKIVVTFDCPGESHRKKLDENYKGNRPEMPQEIQKQIVIIKNMLEDMHIPQYEKAGVEADDIIGILCSKLKDRCEHIYVVTADKDMCQLIDDKVSIFKYIKKKWRICDSKYVEERYGIKPNQFRDYLAIVGDVADNIPKAIPKVGPKTAAKLLKKYKRLENLPMYNQYKERLDLNKKLVTIRR